MFKGFFDNYTEWEVFIKNIEHNITNISATCIVEKAGDQT